jgi:polysaccharide pyruvyl transferase WcaK-like protein
VNRIVHTRRLERHKRAIDEALQRNDLVIVGGGQLVQDSALYFPLKLDVLVRACGDRGIPVAFFSVGVGTKWSRRGWELCHGVMDAPVVKRIYCRDQASAEFLRGRLGQAAAGKVRTTFDVALLAARVYPTAARDKGLVGIGVISPAVTSKRDPHHPLSARRWSMAFHRELCSTLVERGKRVELFTNGSVDDHRFAEAIHRSVRRTCPSSADLSLADRPPSAGALVDRISRYAWIIAGRLHANVIAESLGTPWIGFGWDEKVMAFARMVSKERCVIAAPRDAGSVLEQCSVCFAEPQTESRRDLWEARLHNDITDVLGLVSEGGYEDR